MIVTTVKKIAAVSLVMGFLGVNVLHTSMAFAYAIEQLPGGDIRKDFVVGPGKIEETINPGESRTVNMTVTNRMGVDKTFQLEVEDFKGSTDLSRPVTLLGDERGPYSLRNYIHFAEKTITLKTGERATVPVTITIPADEEPGGKYGSVVVSTVSKPGNPAEQGEGGAAIVSRIGTLFFITIPGKTNNDASLTSFTVANNQKFFSAGPINFQLLFENRGSIHENPYGEIRITNLQGSQVGMTEVTPWFVLPGSLRSRDIEWNREYLFGRYVATAKINRGYDNIIDEKSVVFYVFPWPYMLAGLIVILLLVAGIRYVASKIEIKVKK